MPTSSDTKRPRSVKAEFDPNFSATALGGLVLCEQVLRSLGVRRMIGRSLPARNASARHSMVDVVHLFLQALLAGERGLRACEFFRGDPLALEITGVPAAPSDSTLYRVLCELAGLLEREQSDFYEPAGARSAALDMWGKEMPQPRLRRVVPEEAERAKESHLSALNDLVRASARACFSRMDHRALRTAGYVPVFLDGTDLEVEGSCFDAARMGRDGKRLLRWMTVMVGPLLVAQELCEGNRDEGRSMAGLIDEVLKTVRGAELPVLSFLALMDAAFFEKQVIESLPKDWHFIVCANQQRPLLTRLAQEQNEALWQKEGPDAKRGWAASESLCFVHQPEDWDAPATIVCKRYQKADEIEGTWHYSFLATRLEAGDLPAELLEKHGYCQSIWMLYGTKQGRENHYKTPLRDLSLHHPPSCRLGVNQAYYALASVASNIAMVLRYRVIPAPERGITLWRLRERYFRIAGYLKRGARCITVFLAGATVDLHRQALFRKAMAEAARL